VTIIPVQTPFLRMTGIGVENAPADPADPHDLQGPGVHLRWSFPTRLLPGVPMPIGWPVTGFTLYRREAEPTGDGSTFELPDGLDGLLPDASVPVGGGGRLEFDPDALKATLTRVPAAAADLNLLLDAYPLYVTLRFAAPVRRATLFVANRPLQGRGPRLAAVRAHDGPASVVDEASHVGAAPNPEPLNVTGDHITHLRFRLNGLRINGYTIFPEPLTTDTGAWEQIAELPPLTAWRAVRDRIPAELHAAYEPGWTDLGAELTRLFDPDDARPRWLRTFTDAGTADGHDLGEDEVPPTWSYSLQPQILLFSIDPFLARLLGLLYVDTSPEVAGGGEFDYLVVGTFEVPGADAARPAPAQPRPTRPIPSELRVPDFLPGPDIDPVPAPVPPPDGTVGWITYARSTQRHPPLDPPHMRLGETDPARTFLPDPATGTLTALARVGLAWSLQPQGAGGPLDTGAVRYDVEARPDGEADWTLLTPAAKAVVAASVDALGTPTFPRHHFIDHRGAGTHEYRVRGIDIFGRRSGPARPLEVTIADRVGPPPPVNVWTRYLDPADPFLAADEQSLGQGLLVRFDYPRRPYDAGADAAGFDLYTVHGPRDLALDWNDPAIWGAPVASVPHQAKVAGMVTSVTVLASGDPATRRVRVGTDLTGGATEGGGTGSNGATWTAAAGYLRVSATSDLLDSDQEYQVESIERGATATFTLAWPVALGLPDPVRGPCTWYPGYQVFVPGYQVPLGGAASVTGTAALGATDTGGNQGRVSAATAFQRVDRAPPAEPGAFTLGVQELLASTPDAYGRSRFTLAWEPAADGARHLVYRALDVAVLARHGLTVDDGRDMDAATLKRLADDPLAEAAFSQLTSEPLDATSYTDETLEGFASNRYLYRLRTVSLAGTFGVLGESSPPVAVPDVVPPRRPTVIRALGGDGIVTVTFSPSTEHDAGHYAVYRAADAAAAADTRSMTLVGTVPHDPAAATIVFTDDGAAGPPPTPAVDHRYRVTAVDRAGNESRPSRVVVARCFSTAPPPVPVPSARRAAGGARIRVAWPEPVAGVTVLVQRRAADRGAAWQAVSTWLDGVRGFEDTGLDPGATYGYRLKAMSPWRTVAESDPIEVPPA
jgi:hypothetical protein